MHIKDILDKANERFDRYLNSPYRLRNEIKDNGIQFIKDCKKDIEIFDEKSKERFIFLFSVFLHINSKDDLSVKFYRQPNPHLHEKQLSYKIYGYEEFDKWLHQENFIFLKWLESELINFISIKKEESDNSILSENTFHQILRTAYTNLQTIEEFIFDLSKQKREIEIDRTSYKVFQYKKFNPNRKSDILRKITNLKFESIYHQIGHLVSSIKYLTMYNEYISGSDTREMYKFGIHDTVYEIYKCLEAELDKIKINNKKSRGRPQKTKSNAPTIKWNGKNKELKDLFTELEKKGWITVENKKVIDVCESILDLFIINGKDKSLYEILKLGNPQDETIESGNPKDENLTFLTFFTEKEKKKTRFSGITEINKKIKT